MKDILERAEEALKDVTPGPWADWISNGIIGVACDRSDIACCSGFDTQRSEETELANARFIAAARELVPEMIDEIVSLREDAEIADRSIRAAVDLVHRRVDILNLTPEEEREYDLLMALWGRK